jgi:hypothetical protein
MHILQNGLRLSLLSQKATLNAGDVKTAGITYTAVHVMSILHLNNLPDS